METPLSNPQPVPSTNLPSTPVAPGPSTRMRAVIQATYGGPEVLEITEIAPPTVADDGVLVRVEVAGVNRGDWHLLTGTPYLVRAAYGLARPARPVPGMAMAGHVVTVGASVSGFKVGDRVFAELNRGGFAEYAAVPATALAHVPAGLSMELAATIPVSGTTALQGLRDGGLVRPGQAVLVNGASGGVGSFAVQIAKAMGAEVTGVCSARNMELVRSLGADRVIDYAVEDFTRGARRYDVIFDLVGNHGISSLRRVLEPRGRLLAASGGAEHTWIGPMLDVLGGLLSNIWSSQPFVPVMNKPNPADLVEVAGLALAGKVTPVIDRRYTLGEVPEAMRYLGSGRVRGKCVVTV